MLVLRQILIKIKKDQVSYFYLRGDFPIVSTLSLVLTFPSLLRIYRYTFLIFYYYNG